MTSGPTVTLRLSILDQTATPLDEECPGCGFDAMLHITITYYLEDPRDVSSGVKTIERTLCGRCRAEEQRAGL